MRKKTVLVLLLCILFCISTASAFGISGASFGSVELGKVHNITVSVYSPEKDFDNSCNLGLSLILPLSQPWHPVSSY